MSTSCSGIVRTHKPTEPLERRRCAYAQPNIFLGDIVDAVKEELLYADIAVRRLQVRPRVVALGTPDACV